MIKVVLIIVTAAAVYFAFRYFTLVSALHEMTEQMREVQKDLTRNQMLHMPVPNQHLGKMLCAANDLLAAIQKERLSYEKREKEFQKQIENISHDLRTPLTVILGYLKMMRKSEDSSRMDAETAETLSIIEKKAETMRTLVTQFYDYSRLNAGDYGLKLGRVDASRALRESLTGNYQLLARSSLDITVDLPEHPVWILGDETALDRIFLNLLQNAGRYAKSFLHIAMKEAGSKVEILFTNDTDKLDAEAVFCDVFESVLNKNIDNSEGSSGQRHAMTELLRRAGPDLNITGGSNAFFSFI